MDGVNRNDANGVMVDEVSCARERGDLTNQVEGRALRTKETLSICKFLLEDVICIYG